MPKTLIQHSESKKLSYTSPSGVRIVGKKVKVADILECLSNNKKGRRLGEVKVK